MLLSFGGGLDVKGVQCTWRTWSGKDLQQETVHVEGVPMVSDYI